MAWPLLAIGAVGLAAFAERVSYLHKTQIGADDFLAGIITLLSKGRILEALTLCEETRGPVPAVIKVALVNREKEEETMRGMIQTVALLEIPLLEKRLRLLGTVAGLAPLLGLLGTVLAVLRSLWHLNEAGRNANTADFAGDLGMALVTTALGLVIALFAYCGREFLRSRIDSITRDLEWVAHGIHQFLLNEGRSLPEDVHESVEANGPSAATPVSE